MEFFSKVRILPKLIFLVILSFISLAALMAVGMAGMSRMYGSNDRTYKTVTLPISHLDDAKESYLRAVISLYRFSAAEADDDAAAFLSDAVYNSEAFRTSVGEFFEKVKSVDDVGEAYELASSLVKNADELRTMTEQAKSLYANNGGAGVAAFVAETVEPFAMDTIRPAMHRLSAYFMDVSALEKRTSDDAFTNSAAVMAGILIAAVAVLLAFSYLIIRSISKPMRSLIDLAEDVSAGDFNVNITRTGKDEISQISRAFGKVVMQLKSVIDEIEGMSRAHKRGDIDAYIDAGAYSGGFAEVAESVNEMVREDIEELLLVIESMNHFAVGNFAADIKSFPGKKEAINNAVDGLKGNLSSVSSDIKMLVSAALQGDFSKSIDYNKYSGDWQAIAHSLNDLTLSVSKPLEEIREVCGRLAEGNLSVGVRGQYKGAFLDLRRSVNGVARNINETISDVNHILGELSSDNYDVSITRQYRGDFIPIKEALDKIINRINYVMREINSSADEVSSGSKFIAESTQSLSAGFTEQTGAVAEINKTIENIAAAARDSAKTAQHANKVAVSAQEYAVTCDKDMKNMLNAMEQITEASNNIGAVVQTIEDIAFQTNLLALNAAVEAARAGDHGRGFTVVADQVRGLSGRSQEAVSETAGLIETTLRRVKEGTKIANETSEALKIIVHGVSDISGLVNEISAASQNQSASIGMVNTGIRAIADVTHSSTAACESTAASTEQLTARSEAFKNMVSRFSLKK